MAFVHRAGLPYRYSQDVSLNQKISHECLTKYIQYIYSYVQATKITKAKVKKECTAEEEASKLVTAQVGQAHAFHKQAEALLHIAKVCKTKHALYLGL